MIYFFGYGADRDPQMMEAIIGRVPQGQKVTLSGFELCIQSWEEIPPHVKNVLQNKWDHRFKSYVLRPSKNPDAVVSGMIWELTADERKLIDNWELTNLWYDVRFIQVALPEKKLVEIQVVTDEIVEQIVDGTHYKTFLNPKAKMLAAAQVCREEYLKK